MIIIIIKGRIFTTIIISGLLISVFLIGNTAYSFKKEVGNEIDSYPEIYDTIDFVTYSSFKDKISSGEDFYVYISIPTCDDCNNFEPGVVGLINKYNVANNIVYIDVKDIIENDKEWEEFKKAYDVLHIPTLARYSNGKLVDKIEWTPEKGISIESVDSWIRKQPI